MFRPQIQKTYILFLLAVIIMSMVYWATNSYERHKTYGFAIKVKAAEIMQDAINSLRSEFINLNINSAQDSLAFGSFLIGPETSIIQTTHGSIKSKLSTLNPDFASMIVEMFIELDLDSTSQIAVSYTGSYPGANIALLSALEAMNLNAVLISSCGSSQWGATNPNMTWIDLEGLLYSNNFFTNKSHVASIGGGDDFGSQLSLKGKKACESSIYKNKLEPIYLDNQTDNVNYRMNYFNSFRGMNDLDLFINVGGGIFTVGDSLKRSQLPFGIIYPDDIAMELDESKTVLESFLDISVPVININHIESLTELYGLPYPHNNKNRIKDGALFYSQKKYNFKVILMAFIISAGLVFFVGIISHREIKKRMHSSEPESIL